MPEEVGAEEVRPRRRRRRSSRSKMRRRKKLIIRAIVIAIGLLIVAILLYMINTEFGSKDEGQPQTETAADYM